MSSTNGTRTRGQERVWGPYSHGKGWRVITSGAEGTRGVHSFKSREEAIEFAAEWRALAEARTVEDAIDAYLRHLETEANDGQGLRPSSVESARHRLRAFMAPQLANVLSGLNGRIAEQLYRRRVAEVRPDTHRGELAGASRWAGWCVEQGWLRTNFFADVRPTGKKSRGKAQLRTDEARRYLATALDEGTPEAIAATMPLLMGMRSSEVVDRTVRDLDDGGALLWIPNSKTAAGVRQLEVPELLRNRLLALCAGKPPEARIFDLSRHAMHYHVQRLCKLAGVPVVVPHSFRGLHATLSVSAGVSVSHVAAALGHATPAVTRGHYLQPGAEQSAGSTRVLRLLDGGLAGGGSRDTRAQKETARTELIDPGGESISAVP